MMAGRSLKCLYLICSGLGIAKKEMLMHVTLWFRLQTYQPLWWQTGIVLYCPIYRRFSYGFFPTLIPYPVKSVGHFKQKKTEPLRG